MKYTVESLLKQKSNWDKDDFIFFGKIRESKQINKSCLSPWYISNFIIEDIDFKNLCQYILMCRMEKGHLYGIKETINELGSPKEIKQYIREYKYYLPELSKEDIYYFTTESNFAKFTQNDDLRNFLISTKDKILVYISKRDKMWGIGIDNSSSDKINPLKWKGKNILGFSLMEVRDKLMKGSYLPKLREYDFYNEELDEVETVLNINDDFIPPADTLREEKIVNLPSSSNFGLEQEINQVYQTRLKQDYILEKTIISDRIRQLLMKNLDLFEIDNFPNMLTYKELEDVFIFRNKVGCHLIIEKSSWDIRKYTYHWYFFGKEYYEDHTLNVEKIFDTYIEALEKAIEEYVERAYKGKDGKYYLKDIDGVYKRPTNNL